jgi:hypothetical protein
MVGNQRNVGVEEEKRKRRKGKKREEKKYNKRDRKSENTNTLSIYFISDLFRFFATLE